MVSLAETSSISSPSATAFVVFGPKGCILRKMIPEGPAFEVFHSAETRSSLIRVSGPGSIGLNVARDKLVFTTSSLAGNIWMLEPLTSP